MTSKKSSKASKSNPVETDFGTRAISNQNFSKMVALPKQALANCGTGKTMRVNVKLVDDNGKKFLKLTPICQKEKEK